MRIYFFFLWNTFRHTKSSMFEMHIIDFIISSTMTCRYVIENTRAQWGSIFDTKIDLLWTVLSYWHSKSLRNVSQANTLIFFKNNSVNETTANVFRITDFFYDKQPIDYRNMYFSQKFDVTKLNHQREMNNSIINHFL